MPQDRRDFGSRVSIPRSVPSATKPRKDFASVVTVRSVGSAPSVPNRIRSALGEVTRCPNKPAARLRRLHGDIPSSSRRVVIQHEAVWKWYGKSATTGKGRRATACRQSHFDGSRYCAILGPQSGLPICLESKAGSLTSQAITPVSRYSALVRRPGRA